MRMMMAANREILAILKEQSVFVSTEYRLLTNCLIEDIDGGKLLFNGLTRACIWLSNKEFKEMMDKDKIDYYLPLYRYYFLVPVDYPEMEIIDIVREQFKKDVDDTYLMHPQSYTILTTTKCNARCFYCYELKHKKKSMSKETAEKIAEFILNRSYVDIPVSLNWFGGEPLYNMKIIDIITSKLRKEGRAFISNFTSNGYLFDADIVKKAVEKWNTQSVQITIDGTESVYNKAKNYIYKNAISPYKKVLNNIANLINYGIQVTIRLNIDNYNGDDLLDLVDEIYSIFGKHSLLSMYCYPIFEDETYTRTEEERIIVFDKIAELEERMEKYGYNFGSGPTDRIMSFQCMADSGDSVIISPEGDLGVCEHFIDTDFWGHIDSDKKDVDLLLSWKKYEKTMDICNDCPLYGDCLRPSKCTEMSKCDKYYKKWKIWKAKLGLRLFYKKYTPVDGAVRQPFTIDK